MPHLVFPGLLEVAGQVSTERERELLAELRTLLGELRGEMRERWHRDLLRKAMEAEGFTIYAPEWWHFDYKDWQKYPIGNGRFEFIGLRLLTISP